MAADYEVVGRTGSSIRIRIGDRTAIISVAPKRVGEEWDEQEQAMVPVYDWDAAFETNEFKTDLARTVWKLTHG